MKQRLFYLCSLICNFAFFCTNGYGQAMHFSQFYNAPLLLNPANTALMQEADFRLGASHRMQWAALPAPFTTTAIYGDFQAFRNKNETNWLGVGFAFFNDNVGDGKLNLFRSELFLAYHIEIGLSSMISAGASASYNSRSVNFSKFTFPLQWDGFIFDGSLPNYENKGLEKSKYTAVNAGVNYAFFPTETFYVQAGAAIANLNRPTETFFQGADNKLQFRKTGNLEAFIKTADNVIVNPTAYYSEQSGSFEMLYGTQLLFNLAKPTDQIAANQLIIGAFHRIGDAVVGVAGVQRNGLRLTASYDYTISTLPVNAGKGTGAFELSLRYENIYGETSKGRRMYNCPRF